MFDFHCAICLNSEDFKSSERDGAPMSTPCGHIYHLKCISRWIDRFLDEDDEDDEEELKCPICNTFFSEEECIRLFPVDTQPESRNQVTQTTSLEVDGTRNNQKETPLTQSPEFLNFVKRIMREKWAAENEVQILRNQKRRLKDSVTGLVRRCLEMRLELDIGIGSVESAQYSNYAHVTPKSRKKKKKRFWWLKALLNPRFTDLC